MTLEEAIKHEEEIVEEEQYEYQECVATHNIEGAMNCRKYAEEHRQLAEWLKDYKRLLEQEPCKVSEYDKDHIWYNGHQYISLRRFLEVKAEAEQEPCTDAVSRQTVKEQMIKYGFLAPDMTVTEFVEELPPVTPTRPKGQWIMNRQFERRTCDNCNKEYRWSFYPHNYCPNCGADMREGEA